MPTRLETKKPSTVPYIDINIIIRTDGSVKRISRPYVMIGKLNSRFFCHDFLLLQFFRLCRDA